MNAELLNACVKFLSQWFWHIWIFSPKWRTAPSTTFVTKMYKCWKLHQMNYLATLLIMMNSILCIGVSEMPVVDSFAPWCPQKKLLLLCDLGSIPDLAFEPESPVLLLILWAIQSMSLSKFLFCCGQILFLKECLLIQLIEALKVIIS